MDKPEPDYYLNLGISQSASASQVKKAYHRLAIIHHPDKKAPGENIDAAEFRKIHDAYEVLSDTTRRAQYDRRYVLIQRRWTQYRKWEDTQRRAEEQRRAKEEDRKRRANEQTRAKEEYMKKRAEDAERLREIEKMWQTVEAERLKRHEEAQRARTGEETRQARAEEEARQATEEEARRARARKEADAARQQDASAITPCVHPHMGKVWWKNGKADCSFCSESATYCFRCPVCDVAACHDCRGDMAL